MRRAHCSFWLGSWSGTISVPVTVTLGTAIKIASGGPFDVKARALAGADTKFSVPEAFANLPDPPVIFTVRLTVAVRSAVLTHSYPFISWVVRRLPELASSNRKTPKRTTNSKYIWFWHRPTGGVLGRLVALKSCTVNGPSILSPSPAAVSSSGVSMVVGATPAKLIPGTWVNIPEKDIWTGQPFEHFKLLGGFGDCCACMLAALNVRAKTRIDGYFIMQLL